MLIAYNDRMEELEPDWRRWVKEIGGLEGNSGNPGHCSKVQGIYVWSSPLRDTSYIEAGEPAAQIEHSRNDPIIPYEYGQLFQGAIPFDFYGAKPVHERLNSVGIYNELYTWEDDNHHWQNDPDPDQ